VLIPRNTDWRVEKVATIKEEIASDHRPLVVDLVLKPRE
jgi:endonuclease/exonuclease/phosphatase (EEP) superfamily protein YafD